MSRAHIKAPIRQSKLTSWLPRNNSQVCQCLSIAMMWIILIDWPNRLEVKPVLQFEPGWLRDPVSDGLHEAQLWVLRQLWLQPQVLAVALLRSHNRLVSSTFIHFTLHCIAHSAISKTILSIQYKNNICLTNPFMRKRFHPFNSLICFIQSIHS